MNEDTPLYNSRIIKTWIEFLSKRYPSIDTNTVLDYSKMTIHSLNDPGYWFSQRQVDRFNEVLVKMTGNPKIAKKAGRYVTSSEGLGTLRQCIFGLIKPMSMYMFIGRIYSRLSRGATVKTKKIAPQKVEIISTPNPGVQEKPYQCENRLGSFESLAELFTNSLAKVEHPVCFHKGGDACHYIITWERSPSYLLKRKRNFFMLFSISTVLFLFSFLPLAIWSFTTMSLAILGMAIALYEDYLEKKELINSLKSQGNAAEALLDEIKNRYDNALLVQEIGQGIATIVNIDDLIKTVLSVMERLSNFDRGVIMLKDESKSRLIYADSFGYNQEQRELFFNSVFHLDKTESKGVFVVAFREKKPIFIDDMSKIEDTLSKRSLELAHKMQVKSMICVPIVYEKESLGILAVDNIKSKNPLTQSDINLLMGVASQTAVGVINATSFQQLKESEKKYRDLVESANSIILRHDIEGNITFFNEFAQRLFRFSEQDIIDKNIIGTILPDSDKAREKLQQLVIELRVNPERRFISEGKNVLRNGQEVWIAWTYKPILDNNDNIREILCIGNDITELKQTEEENRELEVRLQRAQKMEAVGTLAGGVAHDLNNILSGIVSYPELIMMGLPENSPLRKPVETIQKTGEKAAAIVQDLLTLARRGLVSKKVVNLNPLVSDYLKSPEFENLKSRHPNIEVKTRLGKNLLNMAGSPIHLSKTLMNLVTNALEAIPNSGKVLISTRNCYIDKPIRGYEEIKGGDYVTLAVSDDGIGIPPEDIERVFEPFFTKKVMGRSGTGLGMAVVWGTIKDHDGHIDVQSTVGRGTKFTLYFPVTSEEPERESERVNIKDLKGRGELILVVDDAAGQREIATDILEKLGYAVTAVSSGEEAVEYIRHHHVDLLMLDMIMDPGMDGFETYKQIVEIKPDQKAILASGFSETRRVKDAQKLGAGAYVQKPYLLEIIGRAIKDEIHKGKISWRNHATTK